MIQININICWTILFNNTEYEWSELQHDCLEHIKDSVATVHCLPCYFNSYCLKNPYICRDGKVEIYTIFNPEKRHLEFVCIKSTSTIQEEEY